MSDKFTKCRFEACLNHDLEMTLWLLSEIACAEPDDIESNEIEVYGENESGQEGFCSFKITDIAQQAIEAIELLKKEVRK